MKTTVLALEDTVKLVQEIGHDRLMDDLIEGLVDAFASFNSGKMMMPARDGFHYSTPATGLVEWMPVMEIGKQATIKVVGYHPRNPANYDLPTILGTISAYDTHTGHLIGIVDGTFLTALRTGAASAVASRYLASPTSTRLGLIGAGAQALAQLHAISREFSIESVLFYDSDPKTVGTFVDRTDVLGLDDLAVEPASIEGIISTCDIVCTATSIDVGAGPLFSNMDSLPWLHVNAAGSDFEGKVELAPDFLRTALVCPDLKEQAVLQGECQQLEDWEIGPELTEVVQHPGKYIDARERRTIFDSTGLAIEDHVAINIVLAYAEELGLGQQIQIENRSADPKNPYSFLYDAVPVS